MQVKFFWAAVKQFDAGPAKQPSRSAQAEDCLKSLNPRRSEGAGARTLDLRIKSPLLYQLSYALNDQKWPSTKG
jgi:hypothetical protein